MQLINNTQTGQVGQGGRGRYCRCCSRILADAWSVVMTGRRDQAGWSGAISIHRKTKGLGCCGRCQPLPPPSIRCELRVGSCNWPCDLITFALLNFMTAVGLNNTASPIYPTLPPHPARPPYTCLFLRFDCLALLWRSAIKAYDVGTEEPSYATAAKQATPYNICHTHNGYGY